MINTVNEINPSGYIIKHWNYMLFNVQETNTFFQIAEWKAWNEFSSSHLIQWNVEIITAGCVLDSLIKLLKINEAMHEH